MPEDKKVKESKETNNVEKRCFVMMPISDQGEYPSGHFNKVYHQIFQPAIKKAGYKPYRVDENTFSDSIVDKIFEAVQNCEMALCDLSNRNPNVLYELGLRQAYNKPVVLVCDDKTDKIFDVSCISTVFYKSDRLYENVLEAQEKIYDAIISTSQGKETTLLQFVHAAAANNSNVSLEQDKKADIMLRSILNEIRKLSIKSKSMHYEVCKLLIENTQGLSCDQVEDRISSIDKILGMSLEFVDDGRIIEFVFKYIDDGNSFHEITNYINSSIGKIVNGISY